MTDQPFHVPDQKLSKYLFAEGHTDGWPKGRYLLALGFSNAAHAEIAEALIQQARNGRDTSRETEHGRLHEIKGPIDTPSGKTPTITTVWIEEPNSGILRFVTFLPYRKGR
jgi:hypothetical protein